MPALEPISLKAIPETQGRLTDTVLHTLRVRLNVDDLIAATQRLVARVVAAPYEDWLLIFRSRSYERMGGLFIHAFSNPAVMAGHGTIGLETLEDLPDVRPWS